MDKQKKVVVAMSGGVDSSTCAYILKKEGYEVIGATMKLLDDEKTTATINDAIKVCESLNIKHYTFDLVKEFKEQIISNFVTSYQKGKTPNPCVLCNKFFKFGLFYEKAKEIPELAKEDFYIATGHYANIEDGKLKCSSAKNKDQSYFLYGINKNILPKILFPLAKYENKEEVRLLAEKANLSVSHKKDSQEICFIPNDNYSEFLLKNVKDNPHPGNIYLEDNTLLGKHKGLTHYTIGQRKGLNISYKEPLYVLKLDMENNALIVGPNKSLFKSKLKATNINILVDSLPQKALAKIRSRGDKVEVTIEEKDDYLLVTFKNPVRAITPGQSIVFYDENNTCLGGGIIENSI